LINHHMSVPLMYPGRRLNPTIFHINFSFSYSAFNAFLSLNPQNDKKSATCFIFIA
jgi:hypothetical protein